MSNNDLFLDYYRQLEDILDQRFPKRGNTTSPVFLYERNTSGEKSRRIGIIRETRNFLSHTPKFYQEDVVEVGDEIVGYLKELLEELQSPITVFERCTKFEKLLCADTSTNLQGIMNRMIDKGYSQVPILNKKNTVIGVFSESVIFTYYATVKEENAPKVIRDILDLAAINNHRNESYEFIQRNALLEEARKRFEEPKVDKRLVVIFVTEHGQQDEEILGILTPWDVI